MNLRLLRISTAVLLLIGRIANTPANAGESRIAFEVASIKPAVTPGRGMVICFVPCTPGERLTVQGNRVDVRYMPIGELIRRAYRVNPYQVSGPESLRGKRFDIMAQMPGGVSPDRLPEMLQSLLADRFKLTTHRETKEQTVYALIVGKSGINLERAAADASTQRPGGPNARQMFTPDGDAHLENGRITITAGRFGPMRSSPGGKWEMLAVTMPALAEFLTPNWDRPVIDQTNLSGAYRFVFGVELQEGSHREDGDRAAQDAFGGALLQALQKGGLKLERRKASIETIVVDHVEQTPTAN